MAKMRKRRSKNKLSHGEQVWQNLLTQLAWKRAGLCPACGEKHTLKEHDAMRAAYWHGRTS